MAIDTERDSLHMLLDAVPDDRLAEAKASIGALADPVLLSLLTAPPEDEELTPEELADLADAEAELADGSIEYVSHEELVRRIGG
jgi:hypothetical protein